MLKRVVRSVVQLLAGLSAGLVILASLAAWLLSQGPVSLGFLNRHIEDGLNGIHQKFHFQLEDTVLTWAGWQRTLDVRILNVHLTGADGAELAYLPELSVSLNARALIGGMIAPKRIELFGPSLVLVRQADGTFDVGFEGGGNGAGAGGGLVVKGVLAQLAARPDPSVAMSYLERLDVVDANIRIEDKVSGVDWRAPASQLKVWRDEGRLHGDLALNIDSEALKAQVGILGSLDPLTHRLDGGITFSPLVPSAFAGLSPALADLGRFDLPVQGTVTVTGRSSGGGWILEALGADLTGTAGRVALPDPVAQTLNVQTLRLRGRYEGDGRSVVVEEASAALADGSRLRLPPSLAGGSAHEMPLTEIALKGRLALAEGRIEIPQLTAELGGVAARLSLTADGVRSNGDLSNAHAALEGELTGVPVDRITEYWPKGLGTDAWTWVTGHMSAGRVTSAKVMAAFAGAGAGMTVESLTGSLDMEDMTVDYLAPLPPVKGISGRAVFDEKSMEITASGGQAGALNVRGGTIRFTGLNARDQYADVTLKVDGPVAAALAFIDKKPLQFASAVGIDPSASGGDASTSVNLKFLLDKNLSLAKVDVKADALLRGVSLSKVLFGLDLTDGVLNLRVDKASMDVSGAVTLGPMPADFSWHRNFGAGADVRSHYVVRGRASDIKDTRDLGFDLAPFPNEFIQGGVGVEVEFTERAGGKAELKANLDIKDAVLSLPAVGWSKAAGVPGTARTHVLFKGNRIAGIPDFAVKAGDMDIAGVARYAGDGTGLQRVDLDRVRFGRNDFAGALIALDSGGWQIIAHGAALDFAPLLDDAFKRGGDEGALKQKAADLALTVTADLGRVWMADGRHLDNVKGTISRAHDTWQSVRVDGAAGAATDVKVVLEGQGEGRRLLTVSTSDAGAMLKAFGFYENMRGGSLALAGGFDDTKPGQPFAGKLQISNFHIVNAPTIAHLVSIMALTGIVDALKGEGLSFQTLEMPMTYVEGVLSLKDARASGFSLGFTASGKVYWDAEIINVDGTMVPAYALNSVFGKIPILGSLLTGGEEGSGMFAATYVVQGPLEKPKVTVNPLTALAPGFLRNLFDVFKPSLEAAEPESPPSTTPPPAGAMPEVVPEKKGSL